nr:hypothetical protein MACL_00002916 [Theileria orientalis]
MVDWIRFDKNRKIDPYTNSQFGSTKREIINNMLFFNYIYIKSDVPLCVYYRRCVKLVRSHILMESSILSQESFKGHSYNLNIDDLRTKNDIYSDVPLCVYYRRCVKLVRSHILMESSILSQESFKGHSYNLNIDDLRTKNDIYVHISDKHRNGDSIDTNSITHILK